MRNPARSPFGAVFQAEVLLNSKRVAPYAMAILFGGNALLWWGWGPAASRGWAVNSDSFIAGMLPVFSFMTLPLFTVLIMADPVIRDFRVGVDPLIFSKPVGRAEYLLGKFFGNFFVLVCCQSAFVLTLFVLQAFSRPGMITQDTRVLPYLKHFLVFVVISHLVLGAFYFTVGSLTRSAKIVYGLGVAFYPLYIAYQVIVLRALPARWRSVLDPLLMNWGAKPSNGRSAEWFNQLVVAYDTELIANRAGMILIAAICLTVLYLRFAIAERPGHEEKTSMLNLLPPSEGAYHVSERLLAPSGHWHELRDFAATEILPTIPLPEVSIANEGSRANVKKMLAVLGVELRLLLGERSLFVIAPLVVFLSVLEVAFYNVVLDGTYSAAYATNTANSLLLFLFGMTVFYIGEAMHRDREAGIESVLWTAAAPNYVFLLSKFLATLLLTVFLLGVIVLSACAIQVLRGHTPIDFSAYFAVYTIILLPGIVFMAGASIALNVLLRDKYLFYVVSIAIGSGLFYMYGQGHNHWLYNPLLYQLWNYADLTGAGSNQSTILIQRVYCLAVSTGCLSLAHLFFRRKSTIESKTSKRLSSKAWSILIVAVSAAVALIAGLMIDSR